jgi:cytochrome bd-type quinol oxidase subunit 1
MSKAKVIAFCDCCARQTEHETLKVTAMEVIIAILLAPFLFGLSLVVLMLYALITAGIPTGKCVVCGGNNPLGKKKYSKFTTIVFTILGWSFIVGVLAFIGSLVYFCISRG